MAPKNLIEQITPYHHIVDEVVRNTHETSPIARCGREVLAGLERFPNTPYHHIVNEAIATVAKKHGYCVTTKSLLLEKFTGPKD